MDIDNGRGGYHDDDVGNVDVGSGGNGTQVGGANGGNGNGNGNNPIMQLATALMQMSTKDKGEAKQDPLLILEHEVLETKQITHEDALEVLACWTRPVRMDVIDILKKNAPAWHGLPQPTPSVGKENGLTVHMHTKLCTAINYLTLVTDVPGVHTNSLPSHIKFCELWQIVLPWKREPRCYCDAV